MIRALSPLGWKFTFLLDGLESRFCKTANHRAGTLPFFRVTYLTLLVLLAYG